ncbi:MAG TPA: cupin domain-containing protein [Thermomicrobiales bacterium]|nr:cupin domain-containing protein [Thermomicrobiales bacterium]
MLIARDADRDVDLWRDGVETRVYASATAGSRQLVVFEQVCAPGVGAPAHLHAVEEVLRVIEGEAEVSVGDERATLGPGDAVTIPAGIVHGFTNSGAAPLRVLAILASPTFEAHYVDPPRDSRRWLP